jgi:hypothetical protein
VADVSEDETKLGLPSIPRGALGNTGAISPRIARSHSPAEGTERAISPQQAAMNDQEREAIREADAEDARRSRVEHGFRSELRIPQRSRCWPQSCAAFPHPAHQARASAMKGNRRRR